MYLILVIGINLYLLQISQINKALILPIFLLTLFQLIYIEHASYTPTFVYLLYISFGSNVFNIGDRIDLL